MDSFLISPKGRITRFDYLVKFVLPIAVLSIIPMLADVHVFQKKFGVDVASLTFLILLIWPTFAVGAKRCHDRNKSGYWQLLTLIPVLGSLWWIAEMWCMRGTVGPNNYGPDPLGGTADERANLATKRLKSGDDEYESRMARTRSFAPLKTD